MYNIPKSSPGMIQHGYSPTAIETFPAGADIPFGAAVMLDTNGTVVEATNGNLIGFAIASHVCVGQGKYLKAPPLERPACRRAGTRHHHGPRLW
mgnify:CR=1 FL=1